MFRPIPAPRRRLPPTPGHMTGVGEAILQNPAIDYDTHRSPRMLPQVPGDHGKYSDYYDSDYTQDYQQYYANQPVYYQPIQGNVGKLYFVGLFELLLVFVGTHSSFKRCFLLHY